jgi:hypothetical protein
MLRPFADGGSHLFQFSGFFIVTEPWVSVGAQGFLVLPGKGTKSLISTVLETESKTVPLFLAYQKPHRPVVNT